MILLFLFCSTNVCGGQQKSVQRGKATYYSKRATGSRTSSGARLHHDSLTCAHRTHPFGTRLKVTNPANKKYTIVKVTDRGPYGKGKIIDLTYRAAHEIGIIAQGVAMVEVEVYNEELTPIMPAEVFFTPFANDFADMETDLIKVDAVHPIWQQKKIEHKTATEHKRTADHKTAEPTHHNAAEHKTGEQHKATEHHTTNLHKTASAR